MASVTFTFTGTGTYTALIAKLAAAPVDIGENEFRDGVHEIFLKSQDYVPVLTGALHDSGRVIKIS